MRWRRWICILAALGVLLHAGALVRHNGVMLGAALQANSLLADLGVICHGSGTDTATKTASLPGTPPRSNPQSSCPLCSGLGSAFALTPPLPAPMATIRVASVAEFPSPDTSVASVVKTVPPPARGPPALA